MEILILYSAIFLAVVLSLDRDIRGKMLGGAGIGCLAGAFLGPVAMFAFMKIENARHGTTFLGLELVAAPFLGAMVLAIPGAIAGVVQGGRERERKKPSVSPDDLG